MLCVDEKSQIQALDRTQPGLPLKKGRARTMTHDYKRYGTTTLFAALNTLDGKLISTCMKKHRHQEWLKFLRQIDRETPPEKELHLIVDNYATHKHAKVGRWLARHKRFHIHFTPTSSSWLNMVERFFRDLTVQRVRRGVFRSVDELVTAIDDYIDGHNDSPKPFIWTAKASDILEKVKRGRAALHKVQSERRTTLVCSQRSDSIHNWGAVVRVRSVARRGSSTQPYGCGTEFGCGFTSRSKGESFRL